MPISFKAIAPKVCRHCNHTTLSLPSPMLSCYMPQAMAVRIMASPRSKDASDIGIVVAVMVPHHEVTERVTVDACCSSATQQQMDTCS
jgi:hypothetical protein